MPDLSGYAGNAGPLGIYSDAAKRISDSYNMHASLPFNHGHWLAIRIQDGMIWDPKSHETVFDTRADAIRIIAPFESLYFYMRIVGTGMTPQEASMMLNYNRALYTAGARMPSPTPDVNTPGRRWELFN